MAAPFVVGLREGLEVVAVLVLWATAAGQSLTRPRVTVRAGWVAVFLVVVGTGAVAASGLDGHSRLALDGVLAVAAAVALFTACVRASRSATSPAALTGEVAGVAIGPVVGLVVLREALEAVVFASPLQGSPVLGSLGLALGAATAVGVYALLVRFSPQFGGARLTVTVQAALVLVSAGLVAEAIGAASDGGWLALGSGTRLDLHLSGPVADLLAPVGDLVFGVGLRPTVAEAVGWTLYVALAGAALVLLRRNRRPGPAPVRVGSTGAAR